MSITVGHNRAGPQHNDLDFREYICSIEAKATNLEKSRGREVCGCNLQGDTLFAG